MLTIDEAIKVSKILATAPEERIPMILSVLRTADLTIDGLQELEEWRGYKDMAVVIDLDEFLENLFKAFPKTESDGRRKIPAAEFSAYCKKQKIKPTLIKRALAKKGYLRTNKDGEKTEYTEPAYVDGKTIRCVVLYKPEVVQT